MIIINLFGGPGSGKSTIAAGLFYKMKTHHINTELVTEYAKELVYDGTLEVLLDRQEYIFAEQNQRLHRLRNKVDFAITDSPILLSRVYADLNSHQINFKYPLMRAFQELVNETFHSYENINVFLERPNQFQESGRIHSEEQSKAIDNKIHDVLREIQATYRIFPLNTNTVDDIYNSVVLPNILNG